MSDETKTIGRRNTLKLATAVTALGAGLGIVLDAKKAAAGEAVRVRFSELGNLSIKLIKLDDAGRQTLLETIDVSALARVGAYSIKLYNTKSDGTSQDVGELNFAVER